MVGLIEAKHPPVRLPSFQVIGRDIIGLKCLEVLNSGRKLSILCCTRNLVVHIAVPHFPPALTSSVARGNNCRTCIAVTANSHLSSFVLILFVFHLRHLSFVLLQPLPKLFVIGDCSWVVKGSDWFRHCSWRQICLIRHEFYKGPRSLTDVLESPAASLHRMQPTGRAGRAAGGGRGRGGAGRQGLAPSKILPGPDPVYHV